MLTINHTRARRNGGGDVLWLPGKSLLVVGSALLVGALLGSLGSQTALRVSLVFDLAAFFVGVSGIFALMYLLFFTRGRGHYQLTLWKIADIFVANILAQAALNIAAWKFASPASVFSHTTADVSALYALYDLALYSLLVFSGGGLSDNLPTAELTRTAVALQQTWASYSYIILFTAADALLAAHTEDQRQRDAAAAGRKQTLADKR